jgi:hypothetical protein
MANREQVIKCDFCPKGVAAKFYTYYINHNYYRCCYKCWIARMNSHMTAVPRSEYNIYLIEGML